jgi:hypothetical protein
MPIYIMKYHKLNGSVTEKKFRLPRVFNTEQELEQFRGELAIKHEVPISCITFNPSWDTGEDNKSKEEIVEYFKEVDKEFRKELAQKTF